MPWHSPWGSERRRLRNHSPDAGPLVVCNLEVPATGTATTSDRNHAKPPGRPTAQRVDAPFRGLLSNGKAAVPSQDHPTVALMSGVSRSLKASLIRLRSGAFGEVLRMGVACLCDPWGTVLNTGLSDWKACWGQPLTSSNLVSSATPRGSQNRRSERGCRLSEDKHEPGRLPHLGAAPESFGLSFGLSSPTPGPERAPSVIGAVLPGGLVVLVGHRPEQPSEPLGDVPPDRVSHVLVPSCHRR